MTISSETINAIQRAGQAIDAAREQLNADTQAHADRVAQAVAGNPFGVENDALFNTWKALARIAQEVQMIEVQFRVVYESAGNLAMSDATPVAGSPRLQPPAPRTTAVAADDATDVEPKAQRRRPGPKGKRAAVRPVTVGELRLKGNNARVYRHVKDLLNRKTFTHLTQASIATGAGIPLGSVAAAIRQLSALGVLSEGERGQYKLA